MSAAIAAFVPDDFLLRVLPDRPALAVPVADKAGGGNIPDLITTSVAQIQAPDDPYE